MSKEAKFRVPEGCREIETRDQWMRSFLHNEKDVLQRIKVWSNARNPYFTVGVTQKAASGTRNNYWKFLSKSGVETIIREICCGKPLEEILQ